MLLEARFKAAERDYKYADVGTDQEEDAEDLEESISAEQMNSTWKITILAHSKPIEKEASLYDQKEQAKVEELRGILWLPTSTSLWSTL